MNIYLQRAKILISQSYRSSLDLKMGNTMHVFLFLHVSPQWNIALLPTLHWLVSLWAHG